MAKKSLLNLINQPQASKQDDGNYQLLYQKPYCRQFADGWHLHSGHLRNAQHEFDLFSGKDK